MSGPDGHISRLIVDTDGNVIEGQHRLEALRQLGVKNVPVHVIKDLASNVDTVGLENAIKSAQSMHGDQRHQIIQNLLEAVAEEGSARKVREDYEEPTGYTKAWNAALDFLEGKPPEDHESWWDKSLTTEGRKQIMDAAGLNRVPRIKWKYLNDDERAKLLANRAAAETPLAVSAPQTQTHGPSGSPTVQARKRLG